MLALRPATDVIIRKIREGDSALLDACLFQLA